jgi:hypothetical protein
MHAKWYFAENGKSVGPVTVAHIREQTDVWKNPSLLVWTAGMAGWTEAWNVPELAAEPARPAPAEGEKKQGIISTEKRAELAARARHEIFEYLAISAYLWVCFGALVIYKTAVLRSVGVEIAPMGLALVKALISAKFIMILQALKLGDRADRKEIPFAAILRKAAVFTIFLIILTIIEELVVGHLHGKGSGEILEDMAGGTVPQAFSIGVLLFLIMIPFFAFRDTRINLWKSSEN